MSQEAPKQTQETQNSLQALGGIVRGAGAAAVRPFVSGYETTRSAFDVIEPEQLLRNLGAVAEAALGLRDGAHPVKIEMKPARIDILIQRNDKRL
jgi:hypothetical protein